MDEHTASKGQGVNDSGRRNHIREMQVYKITRLLLSGLLTNETMGGSLLRTVLEQENQFILYPVCDGYVKRRRALGRWGNMRIVQKMGLLR